MGLLLSLLEFLAMGMLPVELTGAGQGTGVLLLAVAVGAALTWMILRGTAPWPVGDSATGDARAMRRRSERLPVLSLRDPDAAGRPRPRAPGAALSAARPFALS